MQKIQKIISLILTALGLMKKQAEIITPVFVSRETVLSEPTPLTNTEKLCRVAISYLGKDASPKDLASDGLGCAESISNIIHEVFPDFQSGILGTDSLKYALNKSPHFKQILYPQKGCIIISPRTATEYGHVGIMLDGGGIASNNSKTGTFDVNYNWDLWIKTFGAKGRRLYTYIYEVI